MTLTAKWERSLVERIANEEASSAGVALIDLITMNQSPKVVRARHRAWRRIRTQTGWGARRMARVWGCERQSIEYALKPAKTGSAYDARTLAQLHWLYGPERAHAIETGTDVQSNNDIAAWARLGRWSAAA